MTEDEEAETAHSVCLSVCTRVRVRVIFLPVFSFCLVLISCLLKPQSAQSTHSAQHGADIPEIGVSPFLEMESAARAVADGVIV